MLSRRSFISLALATGAASFARAELTGQTPTILRLERRTIEVNGKAASVFGIKQPDGRLGLTPKSANRSTSASKTISKIQA